MNTVSQTFNLNRFVAALRKEVVENNRTLLFSVIAVYGILAMIMIIGNITLGANTSRPETMLRYNIVFMVYGFGSIIVASLAFRGLKDKKGRTEFLTSPSSTLEKYLVNVLIYVVGFFVVFPICAQLADLTRILVLWPWSDGDVPGPINFLNTFHNVAHQQEWWKYDSKVILEITLWLGVLASPALYLLGSVLWPKLSFLKTFAAVYVIEIVIFILAMIGISIFSDMPTAAKWLKGLGQNTVMLWYTAFIAIQLIVYWPLSWYLFKRKDVVSLKWWK
ncbi:MAG: hypothetical protein IKX31_11930 [Muribaculaceae bacterium]|nr:hypothetical protein [Muribaculaceae bacterium]